MLIRSRYSGHRNGVVLGRTRDAARAAASGLEYHRGDQYAQYANSQLSALSALRTERRTNESHARDWKPQELELP